MRARYLSTLWLPLLLLSCLVAMAEESKQGDAKQAAAKKPQEALRYTISKETTRILGPLKEDGSVDYLEAMNRLASEGVTPQNNAAVLIFQALGPNLGEEEFSNKFRKKFFKRLGIEIPPEKGDYLVSIHEIEVKKNELEQFQKEADPDGDGFDEDYNEIDDEYGVEEIQYKAEERAAAGPWTKKELPLAARWIEANKKPLALISQGVLRDRCYMPLVSKDSDATLVGTIPSYFMGTRKVARLLMARAMMHLGEGDVEAAWQDLMDCHRYARHIARNPMIITMLIGQSFEGIALDGGQLLAQSGRLSSAQAIQICRDLEALPPMPRMVDALDQGERYFFLDAVALLSKGPEEIMGLLSPTASFGLPPKKMNPAKNLAIELGYSLIDWNEPFKMGNKWYDKMVGVGRQPTVRQRTVAIGQLNQELKEWVKRTPDYTKLSLRFAFGIAPGNAIGHELGKVLIGMLVPSMSGFILTQDRDEMELDLTRVTLALAAYRKDHGKFPNSLGLLKGKYLGEVPQDRFVEKPLVYERTEKGYRLYSLGPNGTDDKGIGQDDEDAVNDEDDIAVHFPPRKPEDDE